MMDFLAWVQSLSYSSWLNESSSIWAYPTFLFLHILGMSIVAGGATMISFAILGLWPNMPLKPLDRIFPILYWGFVLNAFTGLSILMKDATTTGVNPAFWTKLLFAFIGLWLLVTTRKRVFRVPTLERADITPGAKMLAWASLLAWFFAILAGRLIAYVGPVAGV
jgi:hypothetical protein